MTEPFTRREIDDVFQDAKPPTPSKPSIGRIVHYVQRPSWGNNHQSVHRPAIVLDVHKIDPALVGENDTVFEDMVMLKVFSPHGDFTTMFTRYSEDHEPESWHWPEREG